VSTGKIDGTHYRNVMGTYPTGVTVVSAASDDGPVGLAIGSFTSVSLDPPLVVFCPGSQSSSWPKIRESGRFCVSVLADDQGEVSNIFASKVEDKFGAVSWAPSSNGAPRIDGCISYLDCDIHDIRPGGDHDIVVGLVTEMEVLRPDHGPLVFLRGGYGRFEG